MSMFLPSVKIESLDVSHKFTQTLVLIILPSNPLISDEIHPYELHDIW